MSILLLSIGHINQEILERLAKNLKVVFHNKVSIGKEILVPESCFNKSKNQYLATAIGNEIFTNKEYREYERILGIINHDLYVPELNFIFGIAFYRIALISLARLYQGFYSLKEDKELFHKRTLKEAVHELGHTYGLNHCKNKKCVMFFSNSLSDTDRKDSIFCKRCHNKLKLDYPKKINIEY